MEKPKGMENSRRKERSREMEMWGIVWTLKNSYFIKE